MAFSRGVADSSPNGAGLLAAPGERGAFRGPAARGRTDGDGPGGAAGAPGKGGGPSDPMADLRMGYLGYDGTGAPAESGPATPRVRRRSDDGVA